MIRSQIFITLIFISFNTHSFEHGFSWSGSSIGYSTVTKGYLGVGGLYEKVYSEKWVLGAGAFALVSEFVTIYGPQASARYFFDHYDAGKWHISVQTSYNFFTIKDESYSCGCRRFGVGTSLMYQWTFGDQQQKYFSLGLGTGVRFNKLSPVIDFGFKF